MFSRADGRSYADLCNFWLFALKHFQCRIDFFFTSSIFGSLWAVESKVFTARVT
jgi:hypothetical protein